MKQPMHIDSTSAGVPDHSTWLNLPYPGQTAHMTQHHLGRMRLSKFSRPDMVLAVGPNEEAAGTKLNRAKRAASGYQTLGMAI
jgi:hypothetical protein